MTLYEKRAYIAFPSPHGFSTKRAIDEAVNALQKEEKTLPDLLK